MKTGFAIIEQLSYPFVVSPKMVYPRLVPSIVGFIIVLGLVVALRLLVVLAFGQFKFSLKLMNVSVPSSSAGISTKNVTFRRTMRERTVAPENSSLFPSATKRQPHQHIVYLGDSLTRYRFLDDVWRDHFGQQKTEEVTISADGTLDAGRATNELGSQALAPDWLLNEHVIGNWATFFNKTTDVFGDAMKCDCARGQVFNLGQETENRYYHNRVRSISRSFFMVYGDNMLAGHCGPNETRLARPRNYTTVHWARFKWHYLGGELAHFLQDHVARLDPKATQIQINAGHWPHGNIRQELQSIFEAALQVTEDVVWWESNPGRNVPISRLQSWRGLEIDERARGISQKELPVRYVPFPRSLWKPGQNRSADYFDGLHFAKPRIYRDWNRAEPLVTWDGVDDAGNGGSQSSARVTFIIAGASRSFAMVQKSILQNVVSVLCPAAYCHASVFLQLSLQDNVHSQNRSTSMNGSGFFVKKSEWPDVSLWKMRASTNFHMRRLDVQSAFEKRLFEDYVLNHSENPERQRTLRHYDPRRYSMWFTRYAAWKWMQDISRKGSRFTTEEQDLFVFLRPDIAWTWPVPPLSYFNVRRVGHVAESRQKREQKVWVHDTWFAPTPDTFAFLSSSVTARAYFSMESLVKPGVACLGGPNLELSHVPADVLKNDWACSNNGSAGYSELILWRKLEFSKISINWLHAAAVLVRVKGESSATEVPFCFLFDIRPNHGGDMSSFVLPQSGHAFNPTAYYALCQYASVGIFSGVSFFKRGAECLTRRRALLNGKSLSNSLGVFNVFMAPCSWNNTAQMFAATTTGLHAHFGPHPDRLELVARWGDEGGSTEKKQTKHFMSAEIDTRKLVPFIPTGPLLVNP